MTVHEDKYYPAQPRHGKGKKEGGEWSGGSGNPSNPKYSPPNAPARFATRDEWMSQYNKNLSPADGHLWEEKLAIIGWTDHYHSEIRARQKGYDADPSGTLARKNFKIGDQQWVNEKADHLSVHFENALKKSPLYEKEQSLYRGLALDKKVSKSLKPGDALIDNALTSFSEDKNIAATFAKREGSGKDKIVIKIPALKKHKGYEMPDFQSKQGLEREIVVDRPRLRIKNISTTKIKGVNMKILEMEEIDAD